MLDTRINVQTPEGIELTLSPAGLLPRCLAWAIDMVIRVVVLLVLALVTTGVLDKLAEVFIYIGVFAIWWLYPVLFEAFYQGRTPGKALMGIKVVQANGSPLTLANSVLRNLLRVVDFLPMFYLLGCCSTLFTRSFQRLGDIIADTYVIYKDEPYVPVESASATRTGPRPLRLNLRAADHRAIMLFDERRKSLSEDRAREIAGILSTKINGTDAEIQEQLHAHANWLTGASSQ